MLVESLSLRDFRNLVSVDIDCDPRFNVVVGQNGHGKTNLIESVFLLAALKSFRSLRNAALIRHGQERAICKAWIDRGGSRREVEVSLGPRSRRISLNGSPVRRLSDFFGLVNTVAFCPEDITVLRGAPADRRVLLDRMIFNARPSYAAEMSAFEDTLRNRNALLREGEAFDRALLDIYDTQLVEHGLRVIQRRRDHLARFREPFQRSFAEIFGPNTGATLEYRLQFAEGRPDHDALLADDAHLEQALRDAVRQGRQRDIARGYSTVGPHRDDLQAMLFGQPMREFASQGQQRAFVLAIKVTEIRLLEAQLGYYPVLLLDDVSSELDAERNEKLFEFLAQIDGQVFITTTDTEFIRLAGPFTRWRVCDGVVSR